MNATSALPSGLVIASNHRETLEDILDALAPTFVEPGPRFLRKTADKWCRMLLIPGEWVVHDVGPIAPEVHEASRIAYLLGAAEVHVITHEMTTRQIKKLSVAAEPNSQPSPSRCAVPAPLVKRSTDVGPGDSPLGRSR